MKKVLSTALLGASLFMMSNQVLAENTNLYVGLKAGKMSADASGFDDATNVGVVLGYKLNNTFALEGEITDSSSDGSFSPSGKWSVDTTALYAVGRWGDQAYLKAKAGILNEDVSVSVPGSSLSGDDTGLSLGIGVGYHLNDRVNIEAEYTIIEEDLDFFSVGLNYAF